MIAGVEVNEHVVGLVVGLLITGWALVKLLTTREYPVPAAGGAIVITGASTGIGRHAALTLAKKGYVVYAGVRSEKDAQSIKDEGVDKLRPLIIDVAKEATIVAACERVTKELEKEKVPLIGLVNNAGLAGKVPVEFHAMAAFRHMFEVHIFGMVSLTQKLLPQLRENKGRIVNVSSIIAVLPLPVTGAYCSSKRAVEGLSDVLRVELSDFDVSVSIVEPAYVATSIFGKITKAIDEEMEVSEEITGVYGYHFRPAKRARDRRMVDKASPPTVTSNAILHAISSPYPHARYVVANVVGLPASLLAFWCWILPDRLRDRAILAAA